MSCLWPLSQMVKLSRCARMRSKHSTSNSCQVLMKNQRMERLSSHRTSKTWESVKHLLKMWDSRPREDTSPWLATQTSSSTPTLSSRIRPLARVVTSCGPQWMPNRRTLLLWDSRMALSRCTSSLQSTRHSRLRMLMMESLEANSLVYAAKTVSLSMTGTTFVWSEESIWHQTWSLWSGPKMEPKSFLPWSKHSICWPSMSSMLCRSWPPGRSTTTRLRMASKSPLTLLTSMLRQSTQGCGSPLNASPSLMHAETLPT